MQLITIDDFIDVYVKLIQRGSSFLLSKLNIRAISRTKSAFNETGLSAANWWIIPEVRKRWNTKISGDSDIDYIDHLVLKHLSNKNNLALLSVGSGSSNDELKLASYPNFESITCIDIVPSRLNTAKEVAKKQNLTNISFIIADINHYTLQSNTFDIIFFNSSLHHFKDLDNFIPNKMLPALKPNGLFVINEYVGPKRLQFSKMQQKTINEALKLIDPVYKTRFKTSLKKNRYYGSGYIRMIISDPSECVDSDRILPVLRQYLTTVEEKALGGNILMDTLKDISHHFVNPDKLAKEILIQLFRFEDQYLESHQSDFIFGVYQKPF